MITPPGPTMQRLEMFTLPQVNNLTDLFTLSCSTAVIFGGLIPYIPQYLKIKRSSNADGFSSYVCLTLLLANILRIMFWFGHPFELPLLIQSFVMIVGMLAMMELCVRVRKLSNLNHRQQLLAGPSMISPISTLSASPSLAASETSSSSSTGSSICQPPPAPPPIASHLQAGPSTMPSINTDIGPADSPHSPPLSPTATVAQPPQYSSHCTFWQWDDYLSYVKFLALLTGLMGLITYLLLGVSFYVEALGFVAVFTESMLGLPQLLRNYEKQSTLGMSVEMVVMWLSGDLFKTLYFVLRHAPTQFYVCGSVQVLVDVLILGQVLYYRRPRVAYRKLPKSS